MLVKYTSPIAYTYTYLTLQLPDLSGEDKYSTGKKAIHYQSPWLGRTHKDLPELSPQITQSCPKENNFINKAKDREEVPSFC